MCILSTALSIKNFVIQIGLFNFVIDVIIIIKASYYKLIGWIYVYCTTFSFIKLHYIPLVSCSGRNFYKDWLTIIHAQKYLFIRPIVKVVFVVY